jgi:condensin complex subunit 3
MRLPDDAEVSDEIWDEVIDGMKVRVQDKIPAIRSFAVLALSRFASDGEDGGIVDLFLEALDNEQNAVCLIILDNFRWIIPNKFPVLNIGFVLAASDCGNVSFLRRSERQLYCLFHHQTLHWRVLLSQHLT